MNAYDRNFLVKGGRAYLLDSGRIRKVTIVSCTGGLYTVRFEDGGGTRVKKHRLFESEELAEKSKMGNTTGFRSPHLTYGR